MRKPGPRQVEAIRMVANGDVLTPAGFAALSRNNWVTGTSDHPELTAAGRRALSDADDEAAVKALSYRHPLRLAVVLRKRCHGSYPGREVHCDVEGCDRTERARNVGVSRMVAYFNGSGVEREAEQFRIKHIAKHLRGDIPGTWTAED